jgi:serine/threonine-protein kinase
MGSVYLADQATLARPVAIKVLHPELAQNRVLAQRFREEAVAASRVHHPRSVAVIDSALLADGTPYIVFEHVRGRALGRLISEQEIPVPRALALVDQILAALDAAHGAGVVHADVKSDNFLVEEVDGQDRVTMIDYGLARIDGNPAPAHATKMISGTPEYMAPEVIRGEPPTVASDIYGVGAILYELLTGTTPFAGGTSHEIMQRHLDDIVVPPSLRRVERDIPDALDRVVLRALAKDPRDRHASAIELAQALREALPVYRPAPGRTSRVMDSARPESPTRTCDPPRPRIDEAYLAGVRRAIGDALIHGDRAQAAAGYLRLARSLAADRRIASAMCELEEGIELLATGEEVERLRGALSALYSEAGSFG